MSVSARNHQRQHGEIHLAIVLLALFEQHGMNVSFEVIDGDQGLVEGEGQRLGVSDSDQQRAGQPRSLGHSQRVDGLVGLPGISQRFADHRHNRFQMLPRSQLRHDAAIRLVGRDLREDDIRDDFLSRIDHGSRSLVAGAFDAENVGASHSFQFKSRTRAMEDGRPARQPALLQRDLVLHPALLSASARGDYNMRDVERKPERVTRDRAGQFALRYPAAPTLPLAAHANPGHRRGSHRRHSRARSYAAF